MQFKFSIMLQQIDDEIVIFLLAIMVKAWLSTSHSGLRILFIFRPFLMNKLWPCMLIMGL